MSNPAFQITDPAYLSAALGPPLLGVYLATFHAGRFHLPVALRETLQQSAVGHLGVYVNKDHIEIMPLRPGAQATPSHGFLLTLATGGIASVKVTNLSHRARIGIPKHFAEAANLDPDLLLIGMQDRIEVWNTRRYFANRFRDTTARYPMVCGKFAAMVDAQTPKLKDVVL